jgi:hypothetical protein
MSILFKRLRLELKNTDAIREEIPAAKKLKANLLAEELECRNKLKYRPRSYMHARVPLFIH